MSYTRETVLTELAEYEVNLTGIEQRFTKTGGGIWIREGDAQRVLQFVRELIDLLDAVLGKPNHYSSQISAYYGHGIHNMHSSPSLQSIRDIISMVKAVQTHIKRPTTVLAQKSEGALDMDYDCMEVCLNVHKITGLLKTQPSRHEKFCKQCGAKTISGCVSCAFDIRGEPDTHVAAHFHPPFPITA